MVMEGAGEGSIRNLGLADTIMYKMGKQQGPTG